MASISLPEHLPDVERLLESRGYTFTRQTASHRHYTNARGQVVTVSIHGRCKVNREHVDNLWKHIRRLELETGQA